MVNSATAEALRPGVLTIFTPRSRAAAMSRLTGPPRLTAISFSSGRRSRIAPVIGARCVIRIDAPPMNSTIASGSP